MSIVLMFWCFEGTENKESQIIIRGSTEVNPVMSSVTIDRVIETWTNEHVSGSTEFQINWTKGFM